MTAIAIESVSDTVVDGIWRVTRLAGLNGAHEGRSADIKRELGKKIADFVIAAGLSYLPGEEYTIGTITGITEKKRFRPANRSERRTLEELNELTLRWAAMFIRYQYRGITRGESLKLLKQVVIWLLLEFKYTLPDKHTLFCPHLNVWDEATYHRIAWNDDKSTLMEFVPQEKVPVPEECVACVDIYQAAHS